MTLFLIPRIHTELLLRSHQAWKQTNSGHTLFSLNFSSAGKGPFLASKVKKCVLEGHFPCGEGGSRMRDMPSTSL